MFNAKYNLSIIKYSILAEDGSFFANSSIASNVQCQIQPVDIAQVLYKRRQRQGWCNVCSVTMAYRSFPTDIVQINAQSCRTESHEFHKKCSMKTNIVTRTCNVQNVSKIESKIHVLIFLFNSSLATRFFLKRSTQL